MYDIVHCPCSLGLTAAMTVRYHSILQGTKSVQIRTEALANMRALNFGTPFHARYYETTITGRKSYIQLRFYEGWNLNSGNYLFTTDTK